MSIQTPSTDKFSQISGGTIHLSDGTASTSKPQPHLLTHVSSDTPPSGTMIQSHFISAGMKNGITILAPAWIVDTGASCHVCSDLTNFAHINSISDTSVTLPDGTHISVTISGTITLSPRLTLTDVLYIPHSNLIFSALVHLLGIAISLFSSHPLHALSFLITLSLLFRSLLRIT